MKKFKIGDRVEWVTKGYLYRAKVTKTTKTTFTVDVFFPHIYRDLTYKYSEQLWTLIDSLKEVNEKVKIMYERQPYVKGNNHAKKV
ncbi:MAG: hypothetical protein KGI08_11465 [Thaumarchaeota archaeon]|nr:hypothetical protein [Nitrososphaerota archaeon]